MEQFVATAEFEPADAVLLAWDDEHTTILTGIVAALNQAAMSYFFVANTLEEESARWHLDMAGVDISQVGFIEHPLDSMWTRDYGPISVRRPSGDYALVDNLYSDDRPFDDLVPLAVAEYFDMPIIRSELQMDGGNFMSNGQGLCVMTSQTAEDNPGLDDQEIARRMKQFFGCEQIVTLLRLSGEETGHVDIFAKFVSPHTVLVGKYEDGQDWVNARILDYNASLLDELILEENRFLSVVRIPMGSNGDGIFRSFVNSLYVNGTVVVPTYATDREIEPEVIEIYRNVLPARTRIVTIDATQIIEQEGAVHCLTQSISFGA